MLLEKVPRSSVWRRADETFGIFPSLCGPTMALCLIHSQSQLPQLKVGEVRYLAWEVTKAQQGNRGCRRANYTPAIVALPRLSENAARNARREHFKDKSLLFSPSELSEME